MRSRFRYDPTDAIIFINIYIIYMAFKNLRHFKCQFSQSWHKSNDVKIQCIEKFKLFSKSILLTYKVYIFINIYIIHMAFENLRHFKCQFSQSWHKSNDVKIQCIEKFKLFSKSILLTYKVYIFINIYIIHMAFENLRHFKCQFSQSWHKSNDVKIHCIEKFKLFSKSIWFTYKV